MNNKQNEPCLAIDTSTNYLSIALQSDNQILSVHKEVGNKQSEFILPEIESLLKQADIKIDHLNFIAYAQGPGAFTGLRIGIGVAQGLSLPHKISLIPIPCLDAVAYQITDYLVLAATDARMGEVFFAWFDTNNHKKLSPYHVGKASDICLPCECDLEKVVGIGNAFALDDSPNFTGTPNMPTAINYLELARSGRYKKVSTSEAELLYIRNKIALTAKEQAEKRNK